MFEYVVVVVLGLVCLEHIYQGGVWLSLGLILLAVLCVLLGLCIGLLV